MEKKMEFLIGSSETRKSSESSSSNTFKIIINQTIFRWGTWWGDQGYGKMIRNKNNQCGIALYATYASYL